MKKFMAMLLALVMTLSLAACGKKADDTSKDDANVDDTTTPEITYAVEAGSAGEEVALANGFKTVSVNSQADGGLLRHVRRGDHRPADGRRDGGRGYELSRPEGDGSEAEL